VGTGPNHLPERANVWATEQSSISCPCSEKMTNLELFMDEGGDPWAS
jgi:hypothetical protein